MNDATSAGIRAYRAAGAHGRVEGADPHRLVQLMFEALLDRLALARGHMERGRTGPKGEALSRAIALFEALSASLDLERGGDIAVNLRALYDYAMRRLLDANLRNDTAALDEVAGLVREVKSAWDAIGPAVGSRP
ncbi:MAG TPA: flagellar export chaperone FliS [Solirubrobacteraceae bacterium]|nr:flagellar export chaperone FliS [Solirubrobacteraceae bacterium]